MRIKEALLTLAITLIGIWLASIAGQGPLVWVVGFVGIVIAVTLLLREESNETRRLTPTPREMHDAEAARLQRDHAALALEAAQRKQAKERIRTKVLALYERQQIGHPPQIMLPDEFVIARLPDEDPEIIKEILLEQQTRRRAFRPRMRESRFKWPKYR